MKTATNYVNADTAVGTEMMQPRLPTALSVRLCNQVAQLLELVKTAGVWPEQAQVTLFSVPPKNVTSEDPITLAVTLIR